MSSVPALIFDCDGVLADTERDGHRPAFNQTFAEAGLPVQLVRGGVRREAAHRRRQGADGVAARPTSSCAANGLPADPEGQKELLAGWHRRKTAIYKEMVRAGRLPGAPRHRPDRRRGAAGRLVAGRRLDVGRGVRARGARARGRRRRGGVLRGLRRRRRGGQEARPGHLPAGARADGRRRGRRDRGRGLAQRPAGRRRRGPALRRDGQRLHRPTRT